MTVVGQALVFGITNDVDSLVTQKVSVNTKIDKKEAKDKTGKVVAVAFYNKTQDISVEGLGTASATVGSSLSLSGVTLVGAAAYVTEVNIDLGNEDFKKSTVKATSWEGI